MAQWEELLQPPLTFKRLLKEVETDEASTSSIFFVGDVEAKSKYLPLSNSCFSFDDPDGGREHNVNVFSLGDLNFKNLLEVYVTGRTLQTTLFVVMIDLAMPHMAMLSLERWLKALEARAGEAAAEPPHPEPSNNEVRADAPAGHTVVICFNCDKSFEGQKNVEDDDDGSRSEMPFEDQQQLRLFIQLRVRRHCTEHGCSVIFTRRSISLHDKELTDRAGEVAEMDFEGDSDPNDRSPQLVLRYLLHSLHPSGRMFPPAALAAAVAARAPTEPFIPKGTDTPELQEQDFNAGITDKVRMGWEVPFEEVVEMPDSPTGELNEYPSRNKAEDRLVAMSDELDDPKWLDELEKLQNEKMQKSQSESKAKSAESSGAAKQQPSKAPPTRASTAKAYFEKLAKGEK